MYVILSLARLYENYIAIYKLYYNITFINLTFIINIIYNLIYRFIKSDISFLSNNVYNKYSVYNVYNFFHMKKSVVKL